MISLVLNQVARDSLHDGAATALASTIAIPLAAGMFQFGGHALRAAGRESSNAGGYSRTLGNWLVSRSNSLAPGGPATEWLLRPGLKGYGNVFRGISYPLEVMRVPGFAASSLGQGLSRGGPLIETGLRRIGMSEAGLATQRNLFLFGTPPALLAADEYSKARKLTQAGEAAKKRLTQPVP